MKKLFVLATFCFFSLNVFSQETKLDGYSGEYKFSGAPFAKIKIFVEDSTLMAQSDGMGEGEIYAEEEVDTFTEPNNSATLKFVRDETGNVIKLEVSASGMFWEGERKMQDLNEFTGDYKMEEGSSLEAVKVVLTDGKLRVDTRIGSSNMLPTEETDVFNLDAINGKIGFTRDESGKVSQITIAAMGQMLEGKRVE